MELHSRYMCHLNADAQPFHLRCVHIAHCLRNQMRYCFKFSSCIRVAGTMVVLVIAHLIPNQFLPLYMQVGKWQATMLAAKKLVGVASADADKAEPTLALKPIGDATGNPRQGTSSPKIGHVNVSTKKYFKKHVIAVFTHVYFRYKITATSVSEKGLEDLRSICFRKRKRQRHLAIKVISHLFFEWNWVQRQKSNLSLILTKRDLIWLKSECELTFRCVPGYG